MAEVTATGSDAMQIGDNAFLMEGTGADDLQLPENLSVADADFSTDGGDLVMTFPDGTEVRVEGYMDNPNPPKLVSADGAEVTSDVVSAMTDTGTAADGGNDFGFMSTEQAEQIQAAEQVEASGNVADNPNVIAGTDGEPIGNIESIEGEVWAIRVDGTRERLELGDQVFQGDILESGADGKVGVLLADETTFAMGSEGRMVLDEMIYDPGTQEGSVSLSVLQGVFTFVSGQVAKTDPDAMTLDTPVATIGIRGTQVGLDLRDGQNLNVTLMEEQGGFVGEVVIVNDGGTSVLNTANAFTSVSDFDTTPSAFTTVSDVDVIEIYAEETLKHLPTRNSAGERTSANTFGAQGETEGENRESMDFLNDFQTDAGPGLQTFDGTVKVTGEYQGINRIEQVQADNTDANPFIDNDGATQINNDSDNSNNNNNDDDNDDGPTDGEELIVDPYDELDQVLKDVVDNAAITDWSYSQTTNTLTATVTGDIDVSDVEGVTFVLTGDDTINVIRTGDGDDTLAGTGADDYLDAGAGDDTIIASPGGGDDTYVGGSGNDTITFAAEDEDLIINLSTGVYDDDGNQIGSATGGDIGTDSIIQIENIIGGSGNDIITGDAGNNIIRGGAGDDTIDGGDGMDTAEFSGTYGQSTFTVSMDGVVTVTGPDGTDTISNVENFLFDGSPNLIVGLEDTSISVNVEDHLPNAGSAGFVVVTGVPLGAALTSTADGLIHEISDGVWAVEQGALEDLTITGAANSAEDFTLSFESFNGSYGEEYFQQLAQAELTGLTDLVGPLVEGENGEFIIDTSLPDYATQEYLQALTDFAQNGGDASEFVGNGPLSNLLNPTSSGSVGIEIVAILDPFTISVGGVDLTEEGANNIVFTGSEDQEVPLNFDIDLSDTDGSEIVSITISGLPTLEVHQVTTQVAVLDEEGEPFLDEEGEPVFEDVTTWEPILDTNGQPVGAHLIYTDANGNDVVLPANDTGTYTLTGEQLNNVRMVGSPDDSATYNLEFSAVVSDDGESTATVMGSATVTLEAVADVPTVTGGAQTTLEDKPVTINFDIDKEDISEHITDVVLTGIPEGSTLAIEYTDPDSGDVMMITLPVVDGAANIPVGFLGEDLSTDNLQLTPPSHLSGVFDLQLQVTSTELNNNDTATNYFDMPLTITAVADELGVTINGTEVLDGDTVGINAFEDGAFGLDISALTADTDGSEVISVTISGVPTGALLSSGTDNGDGSWTLTPEEFETLSITPPLNSDVGFDLTVTVTNVDNNEDTTSLEATVSVGIEAIADMANLAVSNVIEGVEDFLIPLDIATSLNDTDGSESLSITIDGLPAGSMLTAGTDNGDGSWTLTPDQLEGLGIMPGLHISGAFDLTVTATTTEAANGDTAVVTQQIGLNILPDPDAPVVNVTPILGNEDTAIALNIDASLVDTDGSETLSVTIAGVPTGAILSAGTDLGNGVWEIDPTDLSALTITPPLNSNEDFNLTVTATATESDGQTAETTVDVPVSVLGVADVPNLTAEEIIGLEGTPIALNIVPTLTDTDGSETLSITIENIPDGAFLLSGTDVIGIEDGVAQLTPDQLAGLAILPPLGSLDDFDLLVTATSTENDADVSGNGQGIASVSGTMSVIVHEVADPPSLMLFNSNGNEDIPVPLNIGAALTDADEILSVIVTGLPEGATLNKGIPNEDGSWSLEPDDLFGLTVQTPENFSGQFDLSVSATSTTQDGTTSEVGGSMTVSVAGVADTANLDLTDISADEGTLIPLDVHISTGLTDTDGSETLTISIDNIPEGAQLFSGVTDLLDLGALTDLVPLPIVDGVLQLTPDQLAGLVMLPPAGLDTDFSLQVTATTTEADADVSGNGQGVTSVSGIINVDMAAVADIPTLILQDASGLEDGAIPLDISAMVGDASETLSITIAGVPDGATLSAGSNNNDGTWTLTPAQLEGLTITPEINSNEDFQLDVTATSTEQDGTFAVSTGSLSVGVTGVADAPTLSLGDVTGLEDVGVPLNISAGLADTDGSETLSVMISGLPEGARLSAGTIDVDGNWVLTGDQLSGLTMIPPADLSGNFSLTVTATSTENDGDTSSVTGLMNIGLGAVADIPSLILHDAAGFEDDAIPLEISTAANGGDEIVGITIIGVPAGASLSAGTNNGNGTWSVDPADLEGLTITPPANSNVNFQLGVTVSSMDGDDIAEATQALNVSVTAVADKPLLNVPSQVSIEGILDAADLNIEAALGDLDGSESLTVSISNIPVGAVVSLGNSVLDIVGGVVDGLLPNQLSGLQITPPPGFDGNFTIQVTATATDTDPDNDIPEGLETSVSIAHIDVTVENIIDLPDIPDLALEDTLGYEDNPIPLDIDASLTDASETLSLTISGVPEGSVLSAGTDLGNGVWSLLPEETEGLTITPPHDSNVDFDLTVTATSTTDDGGFATNSGTVAVDVIGVADQPNLAASVGVGEVIGGEGFRDIPEFDHDISNVVMYVKDGAGNVEKIKIEDFPDDENGFRDVNDLDLQGFVAENFPGSELIGISVKAGNNGGLLGPGEGEFFSLDPSVIINSLPLLNHADQTFDFDQSMGDFIGGSVGELLTIFPLDIASSLNDIDGSESLSITVTDLPLGVTLSAGTQNQDGSWTLTPDQLDGLSISVPIEIDPDFDFNVTATATENDGDTASVTVGVGIDGDDEADAPDLEVSAAEGDEDNAIALDIDAMLTDTDGSETLSITIGDVPAGAELSAGTDNQDGTWTLTPEQLVGLTITPPADSDVDFTLSVTATSQETSSGDIATTTAALAVTVNAVADTPSVAADDASGTVGQTVDFDITSLLADTDGSESLSITVSGLPDGVTLTAGTDNNDGSFTLTPADLSGLSINLPAGASDDFDLSVTATSTEAENSDQATSTVQALVNVDPTASDDQNTVRIGDVTTGNVLTGEGDSVDPSAAADTGSATGNSMVDISFGGVTKSFSNADDVQTDADGTYIEIAGDHGTLKMYADGTYDYQADGGEAVSHVAGLTGTASSGAVEEAWSGLQTFAFDFGTSYVDGNGKLDPSLADAQVSFNSKGIGVAGGESGTGPSEQLNYSEDSNETESLGINLGGETTSATLTVSNMFKDEEGGEQGAWQAFDADGNLVGEGVLNSSTVDYGGSNNVGTATIEVDGASFQYIVFTATAAGGENNNNDSSDFFVRALQFETNDAPAGEDVFGYTMQDADGDTASATLSIDVAEHQDTTASDPTLNIENATGFEDAPIELDIAAALTDIDGSESLSITLSGVPEGALLSAGEKIDDTTWSVPSEALAGLTITPPADSNVDFDITVTATSTEANGGDTATTTATLNVSVTGVADSPSASAEDVTGTEDQWVALDLGASLTDTDGSESLSVTISGVPAGAELSAGSSLGNGVWSVPAADIAGLSILPPEDFSGEMDMTMTVTSTENDGDSAATEVPFTVSVSGDADAPTVTVGEAAGLEDNAIALNIGAGLTDTDGSETLSVTISGVPSGALLSAGTNNNDGTWTVTPEQLDGLSVTPPHDSNEDFVLMVNATSTEENGDTATTSVAVPVAVTGVADMPTLSATLGAPEEVPGTTDITITNMGQVSAGYNNSYGYYIKDEDGNPTDGVVIWDNAKNDVGDTFTIEGVDPDSIGFFVIPNGDSQNLLLGDNTPVHFEQDSGGNWHAVNGLGVRLSGAGDPVLFSDPSLNEGDFDYTTDNSNGGNQNWEDLVGGGDNDFNDVNVNVEYGATPGTGAVSYGLNIDTELSDTDGSETLSITVADLPEGATLSAGTQNQDGSWTLTPAQLEGLSLTVPAGSGEFDLSITSTSTENDGDTASISTTLGATTPTGDTTASDPTLEVSDASGLEDGSIALDIGAALSDTDGSETLSITISGVPTGAELSAGQNNNDGTWTLTPVELQGLSITPPADSNEDFDLTVTATSTEYNGGDTSSSTTALSVSVTGVADTPTVTTTDASGSEDQWIALDLGAGLTDTDGSESLTVTIVGVPVGAEFSAGSSLGNGMWSVPAADLDGLSIRPPTNFDGVMDMAMRATSTENDGDSATMELPFTVTVDAKADVPTVSVGTAAGLEDTDIALDISAAITDLDGSETLSITIGNVPVGAELSAGSMNNDGTWTLTGADLDGLTITPPYNSNEDFSLSITAMATEGNGDTSTTSATMNVAVAGVADAPTLSVVLGEAHVITEDGEPAEVTIDVDNVLDTDNGFTVSARSLNSEGGLTDASADNISFHASPQGFGVSGVASGDNSELGTKNGVSEQIVVDFDSDVSSVDVTFAWMHSAEHAHYDLYKDGVKVGEGTITGITDNIDPAVTLSVNGQTFDQIVFSAPGSGDDYLINAISFETAGEGVATEVEYPLDITSSLTDLDGSETLSITVSDLPEGASLSAGTQNQDGSWTLTPAQLNGLVMTVAVGTEDFDLSVTATSTENDGDSTSVSTSVAVDMPDTNIDTDASSPNLSAENASGLEDGAIALNIASALTDTDGSESLSITISGVPSGAELSAGTDNQDGTWTLSDDQLEGLTITPPANSNDDFTLNVTATSTENNGGATSSQSVALDVSVTGVADTPTLSASLSAGTEVGGETDIDVSQSIVDAANGGSGRTVTVSGVPSGATLSSGTDNGDGSWTLSAGQLNDLSITPADGASGDVSLTFEVTEDGGSGTLVSENFNSGPHGWGNEVSCTNGTMNIDYNDTASKTFDFGAEHAGQTVTISFGAQSYGGWDSGSHNTDYLDVYANGQQVLHSSDGSTTHTLTVTLDQNGRVELDMSVDTTVSSEGMYIDNFSIAGGNDWTSTVATDTVDVTLAEAGVEYDLDIQSALTDLDGSETLTVTVDGLPDGAELSAGTQNQDGTWTLSAGQLAGLTMTAAAGTSAFVLAITATASENDGDTATVTTTLQVGDSDMLASDPSLSAGDVSGAEDNAIALDISAALSDTDGSESLSITVSGVPSGAALSAGTNNNDGTWTLTGEQLDGLTITPAANSNEDFSLTVTATSTEASNGATATQTASFDVDITGVADAANLSASASLAEGHGGQSGGNTGSGSGHGSGSGQGDGLVAFFEVTDDEKSGEINNSESRKEGELHGVTINTDSDGPSGASAVFDGHNDYIEVDNYNDLETDSGTFVLWFNTDDADDKQALFSKDSSGYDDGGHLTAWVDDGQLEVRLQGTSSSFMVSGGNVSSGAWHQMAFTFGPDGMALYLDGELVDSDSYTGGIASNEEPLIFGASQVYSGNNVANNLRDYFDGQMDQIGVYDRPLTTTELANMYDEGVQQMTTGSGETLVYDLDIQGSLNDVDGSEELTFEIRGLPEGASLSAGSDNGDGNWSLTAADLDGLTLNVASSIGDDFSIEVVAITTEDDGDTAETVAALEIDVAVEEPMEVTGTWRDESLSGAGGDDTITGDSGNDSLFGLGGDDIMDGGSGHDSLFGDAGDDVMNGGSGNDLLYGGTGNDTMDGGHNTDTLWGGEGNDTMDGGTGNDKLLGGVGDDVMLGDDGNDRLYGEAGNDTLDGGSGNDTLVGGEGDDVLTGGWGSDTFKFDDNSGHDIIQDIMDQDTIVFEGQEFHADDMIFNENDEGDVVISFAGVEGQSVTLNGVSMDDLDRNNDGDSSDGYSVTENNGQVTVTLDTQ